MLTIFQTLWPVEIQSGNFRESEVVCTEFNCRNMWSVQRTNILRVLRNVVAKWHHQLGVGCMISHVLSTIMWRNISEQITCTQESRGKAVSLRLATLLFGKWLKKPFLTQMWQRHIDLMRKDCFQKEIFFASWCTRKEWRTMHFCDRDLRQVGPKSSYCISNNMSF